MALPPEAGGFGWVDVLRISAVPLLVLLNGFFVAAEFALVGVRRTQVEEALRQGHTSAHSLRRQIEHLDHSIAATQLGITIASLLLGWIGEKALANVFMPLFEGLGPGWQGAFAHTIAVAISLVIITVLHVVAGELAPKAMALQYPIGVGLWVAIPLEIFTRVTRPFVLVMNGLGNGLIRLLGFQDAGSEKHVHSVVEMSMLVEEAEEAGMLSTDQAEYVQNVFRMSAKKVSECMLPREKMSCLELHMPLDQILDRVREEAHTRMPVYDTDFNNIVGIVNTKDLYHLVSLQGMAILDDALYPAIFLKPDQSIAAALQTFKKSHRAMGIVRNDAGEVLGLITLEDILEEIVGDIEDEHDRPTAKVKLPQTSRAAWRIGKVPPRVGKSGLPTSPGTPPPSPPPS
jgi:CBS domain containing-hemolysin-like protein